MPIISVQKLENADKDADSLNKFVNGAETESVKTRLNAEYPTLANAVRQVMETGGFEPFATETALLASVPTAPKKAAKALDTKKVWLWDGVQWNDTGLSEKDLADANAQKKINSLIKAENSKINDYAYVILDEQNNVGLALTSDGALEVAGATQQKTDKQAGIVWGVADDSENIGFAVHSDTSISHGNINLSEAKVSAIIDEDDVASHVIDGRGIHHITHIESHSIKASNIEQPIVSTYEQDGDIYAVVGGAITQITNDGLNKSPVSIGSNIIFLSKKQGSYKQYIYSNGNIERYHPNDDFLKFKHVVLTGQSLAWGPDAIIDGKMVEGQLCLGAERVFSYNETLGDPQPLQDKTNETIATGFATSLLNHDENILFTGCARGGRAYNAIKKNGTEPIYQNVLNNIVRAKNQYDKNTYVPAVLLIHGEQDGVEGRTDYDVCIKQLINDYNADIAINTGNPSSAVLITCQTSSASGYKSVSDRDSFKTPFAQLKASNDYDDVFLVGPKYQYEYIDHAHYNKHGTRHHGEMMAKVYYEVCLKGNDWKPLQPTKFTVVGNQILIDFHVPVAPLQFDTTYISSVANQGFELTNAGTVVISNVQITVPNQITITCSANVPSDAVISYAFYNGTYQKSGRIEGSRGTLKDSDSRQDIHGYMPLNNWCVHFKQTLIF